MTRSQSPSKRSAQRPRTIVFDCDPGRDDALALIYVLGCAEVDVRALSIVAGNQSVDNGTRNALGLLTIAGRVDIPVYAGAAKPLIKDNNFAPGTHGKTGLDGVRLPKDLPRARAEFAPQYLADAIMASCDGEITLVATGPLTNLALALALRPEIARKVSEVIIMGGSMSCGNVTATAEFNFFTDPEAASMVFSAPWAITMLGLNTTHKALITTDDEEKICAPGGRVADVVKTILDTYRAAYATHGFENPPVHDLCAMFYATHPEAFTTITAPVDIVTSPGATYGMSIVDRRFGAPQPAGPRTIAVDIDTQQLVAAMTSSVAHLA